MKDQYKSTNHNWALLGPHRLQVNRKLVRIVKVHLALKSLGRQWFFQNQSDAINSSHATLRKYCKIFFSEKALHKKAPQMDCSSQQKT